MYRPLALMLMAMLLVCTVAAAAASDPTAVSTAAPRQLSDLYYGEALYYAFQGAWFEAIARLDTELTQHYRLDEPDRDTLYRHLHQAEFAVGDFELAYRMHHRAGRAITRVIEGNVEPLVRNAAIFRLARIYFQKDQPVEALHAVERVSGAVPAGLRDEYAFLRAHILMANGRFAEAARLLRELQAGGGLEGFSTYNLGIALLGDGLEQEGRRHLDRTGQIGSNDPATLAIRDKSNLVLGSKMLEERQCAAAKQVLDRVRLSGPFSNRALLASGWADAFEANFERALVPWSMLAEREVTDAAVQEALLAVPYAYGKLKVYSRAALLYGSALEKFAAEIDKLGASIKSIREGHFLQALVREELKQDANWVVKLRQLPQSPETYYLLDLMASHDFQESLKNYLDLEQLRRKLDTWTGDLAAYEQLIAHRRDYYQPLLPDIDREFRRLDARMRLRLDQRDRIARRLQAMLVAPRPDHLATAEEQALGERIARLEAHLAADGTVTAAATADRIRRLRGVLDYTIHTQYDHRLTEAHRNLHELNDAVTLLQQQYVAYVRTRQAATQSYKGYDEEIRRSRFRIQVANTKVEALMARQGHLIEVMAVQELASRRERLAEFQIKARFAMADSYDRATKARTQDRIGQ